MFKKYLHNKKKYNQIMAAIYLESDYLSAIPRKINFQFEFQELYLRVYNKKLCVDLKYNMLTEEIIFDEASIYLDTNSYHYSKLKFHMKIITEQVIKIDDFYKSVKRSRELCSKLFFKK